MMGGLMGAANIGRRAMKASYRDTNSSFSCGGKRHKSHAPLSEAQKAQLAHLRSLAPKPRKKQRRRGNGLSGRR
jgi:hypothetical protein